MPQCLEAAEQEKIQSTYSQGILMAEMEMRSRIDGPALTSLRRKLEFLTKSP